MPVIIFKTRLFADPMWCFHLQHLDSDCKLSSATDIGESFSASVSFTGLL